MVVWWDGVATVSDVSKGSVGDADSVTTPVPVITEVAAERREPRPRRTVRRGVQARPVPWFWLVGGLALLVLVGRGMAGATQGYGSGAPSSNLVAVAGTTGAVITGPSGLPAGVGVTDPGSGAATTAPTAPADGDRVNLPRASSSSPVPTDASGSAGPAPSDSAGPAPGVTAEPSPGGGTTGPAPGVTTRPDPTRSVGPGPSRTTSPVPDRPTSPAPRPVAGSPVVGVQSGKCVDVAGGSSADRTAIVLHTCNGSAGQAVRFTAAGELRVLGKCLDATGQRTANGTPIVLYTCNGQPNQQWRSGMNGTLVGVQSNLCLDATANGTADGTALELWVCHGGANQAWRR